MKNFKEIYLRMKEHNMSDEQIEHEMMLTHYDFNRLKKMYGLSVKRGNSFKHRKSRKNFVGLTEEELQIGEKNGLSRKLMYNRVRELNWSCQRAITEPVNIKGKKGVNK